MLYILSIKFPYSKGRKEVGSHASIIYMCNTAIHKNRHITYTAKEGLIKKLLAKKFAKLTKHGNVQIEANC